MRWSVLDLSVLLLATFATSSHATPRATRGSPRAIAGSDRAAIVWTEYLAPGLPGGSLVRLALLDETDHLTPLLDLPLSGGAGDQRLLDLRNGQFLFALDRRHETPPRFEAYRVGVGAPPAEPMTIPAIGPLNTPWEIAVDGEQLAIVEGWPKDATLHVRGVGDLFGRRKLEARTAIGGGNGHLLIYSDGSLPTLTVDPDRAGARTLHPAPPSCPTATRTRYQDAGFAGIGGSLFSLGVNVHRDDGTVEPKMLMLMGDATDLDHAVVVAVAPLSGNRYARLWRCGPDGFIDVASLDSSTKAPPTIVARATLMNWKPRLVIDARGHLTVALNEIDRLLCGAPGPRAPGARWRDCEAAPVPAVCQPRGPNETTGSRYCWTTEGGSHGMTVLTSPAGTHGVEVAVERYLTGADRPSVRLRLFP